MKSPKQKLAQTNFHKIKKHLYFAEIYWIRLQDRQYQPPPLILRNKFNNNGFPILENEKIDFSDTDYKESYEKPQEMEQSLI